MVESGLDEAKAAITLKISSVGINPGKVALIKDSKKIVDPLIWRAEANWRFTRLSERSSNSYKSNLFIRP